ncbi:MAG: DUF5058 family protein [bacterium]
MQNYLQYANANVLKWAVAGIVLFILLQSLLFLWIAVKRGRAAGVSGEAMRKAFRAGVTTSIIPTLPILMALIAIAPVLGLPVSWMRLSVIGSAPYELMAAGIGAKTMGVHSLGGETFTVGVFANAIWVMCIGSFWAIMIVALFYKGLKKRYALKASGDKRWQEVLTSSCFMGVFALFMADPLTSGGVPLATFVTSALLMIGCLLLIVKFKFERLREFALTLSMIGGMVMSVVWTQMVG